MKALKCKKIKPNLDQYRILFDNILNCDYGIANSLKEKLNNLNKEIKDLSLPEIAIIEDEIFFKNLEFYNLVNSEGDLFLPLIYTDMYFTFKSKDFYCFSKYGIQSFDLFTKYGKKIYENAWDIDLFDDNIISVQNEALKKFLYKYNFENDELILINELNDRNGRCTEFYFSENRLFVESGYVDENFESKTPFCFDDGKQYKEGLAAVCLNGKWGYININGDIVIDFQFGYANSFKNGFAKVLELKPEFKLEKGYWIDVNSFNQNKKYNYSLDLFDEKFPGFPKKIKKPLSIIRGLYKSIEQLRTDYNYFKEGNEYIDSKNISVYGKWITIDKLGIQIDKEQNIKRNSKNKSNKIQADLENLEVSFTSWLSKIKINAWEVNRLPDELFMNKDFVLQAIKSNPYCFEEFSVYYSDDNEICLKAYELKPISNYSYFSERLKAIYFEDFNKLKQTQEDLFQGSSNNSQSINLDDYFPL